MIFVIMGMDVHPFDRLARAVDELAANGSVNEDFLIQLGACKYEPTRARFERFLSFGDVCENIRRSSAVITHAGAGSTLVCLQQGKRPIMVPRSARFAESVDEHQLPFAQKLDQSGLAILVDDMAKLPAAIADAQGSPAAQVAMGTASELTRWLESFWSAQAGRAAARG